VVFIILFFYIVVLGESIAMKNDEKCEAFHFNYNCLVVKEGFLRLYGYLVLTQGSNKVLHLLVIKGMQYEFYWW
jgi:hypothetical protein